MLGWFARILPPKVPNQKLIEQADRLRAISSEMHDTSADAVKASRKAQVRERTIHEDNVLERELLLRRLSASPEVRDND